MSALHGIAFVATRGRFSLPMKCVEWVQRGCVFGSPDVQSSVAGLLLGRLRWKKTNGPSMSGNTGESIALFPLKTKLRGLQRVEWFVCFPCFYGLGVLMGHRLEDQWADWVCGWGFTFRWEEREGSWETEVSMALLWPGDKGACGHNHPVAEALHWFLLF